MSIQSCSKDGTDDAPTTATKHFTGTEMLGDDCLNVWNENAWY